MNGFGLLWDAGFLKMASRTPSLESLPGANSIGSLERGSISPLTLSGSSPPASDSAVCDLREFDGLDTVCALCRETFSDPKVLNCFHTFCRGCLEREQTHPDKVTCVTCRVDSQLPAAGIPGLLTNLVIAAAVEQDADLLAPSRQTNSPSARCTGCKSKESDAVARCVDCANFLCPNCVMAHQFMHCFEGHRVLTFTELKDDKGMLGSTITTSGEKTAFCPRHKNDILKYYCRTCSVPVCKECTIIEHPAALHDYEHLSDVGPKQLELMQQTVAEAKTRATEIRHVVKTVEHAAGKLQVQYHKAQNEINDTFQFYRSMLEERKQELLKELESVFSAKQIALSVVGQKAQESVDKIYQTCDFVERLTKCANIAEILMFKKLLDTKLQSLMNTNPEQSVQTACELEFVSNYQAIQVGVRNTFGYVRSSSEANVGPTKQPPIARPTNGSLLNGGSSSSSSSVNGSSGSLNGGIHLPTGLNSVLDRPYTNGLLGHASQSTSPFDSNIISKRFNSPSTLGPFSTAIGDMNLNGINSYEKWSNGGCDSLFPTAAADPYAMTTAAHTDPILDLTNKLISTAIFPPKSQIKRQKMIYHCKFGEFGVMEGQFTEPSGVAVNAQNDIIVADTNNHRIQIFDKEGRFKFQFGECGKRDGQLLYPNRVAVVRTSGDIIVTERSPTHQIQIYNQYGQFVRKFGANILQHPRGVTVDNKGRIVVVECKVMRVIIFDQVGNVLQKFGCSKHLEFPNGVVVNDKQEIFISDNRAHCVKVFNYEGIYLRQIGGEGVTNYPIGVGINAAGEILIADNHNNFNLTIFTQDGQLVSALESKVKHAQCFDVALMDDGSVVLASKDYRLYIYRYVQVPPIGM
ncbi:brain tumor protein isoform X1 [Aricia agestis]|uniref:brain tumor protein isoform X1 n=2 Tax=Aricia agestis TaxID=91739 RepID=UPI001C205CE9|nr:brain tumor protein isoform X1 [Aricia agestis]